jgi:ABC-type multidrug transport system ATPase subunit
MSDTAMTAAVAHTPALRFTQLTKRYGNHSALVDFSLAVRQGEFFGLWG